MHSCESLPTVSRAQVWVHADQTRIGFLGKKEFVRALRGIALLQAGAELNTENLNAIEDLGYPSIALLEGVEGLGGGPNWAQPAGGLPTAGGAPSLPGASA